MKFLVDLRATLLTLKGADPWLAALESDLRGLLASWFDVGFLELQRIDWHSPALLLERLVGYEAVHEIRSWSDLKNRLDSDRRCYALFHHRMPNEPLIFVEVALVRGLADSVQRLLDKKAPLLDPRDADTAIFYSISNCQKGPRRHQLRQLPDQASGRAPRQRVPQPQALSPPSPPCRATADGWTRSSGRPDPKLLSDDESSALRAAAPSADPAPETGAQALAAVLARRGWTRDPAMLKAAEPVLIRLAARYLLAESRGNRAIDPVAHFHLSNGARVERIMALADTSEKGMKESATLMVNYLYDPAKIEDYHEDYAGEGKRNASTAVRKLARGWS